MITEAFEIYQSNIRNGIPSKRTIKDLANLGYNKGSAGMIVNNIFPNLISGRVFKRTLSYGDFSTLINYLAETMSDQDFMLVCESLQRHLTYRKQKVNITNLKRILNEITQERMGIPLSQEALEERNEQIRTANLINDHDRSAKIQMLNRLGENPKQSKVQYQGSAYRRDILAIALIKSLRGEVCQLCAKQIQKRNGGFYIEAAHLIPKRNGGSELPSNIVLLCPNHHKEFDLGNSTWKLEGDLLEIIISQKTYSVNLAIV